MKRQGKLNGQIISESVLMLSVKNNCQNSSVLVETIQLVNVGVFFEIQCSHDVCMYVCMYL